MSDVRLTHVVEMIFNILGFFKESCQLEKKYQTLRNDILITR